MPEPLRETLSGQKYAPTKLGRVLILGLGKSGKAVYTYCCGLLEDRIDSLSIAVGDSNAEIETYINTLDSNKVDVSTGAYEFDEMYDLCIASPGISQFSEFYQNAQNASTEIISEVEFAWRESASSSIWIGITGTNGKTTTTALTAHILRSSGMKAAAVGNIGSTCIEAVMDGQIDVYVAEVSSYQLASTNYFAPKVAILLNITPDHLSWHTSHEEYVHSKLKIFRNLKTCDGSYAILDAVGDESRAIVKRMKKDRLEKNGFSYVPLGTSDGLSGDMRKACGSENAAFLQKGVLHVALEEKDHVLPPLSKLRLKGEHNAANALAASASALILGVDDSTIATALLGFEALEHRMEECESIAGIRFFNDSKATNVDATLKALGSFDGEKLIVLLGGKDKGTELSSLIDEAEKKAKAVVCYGEAGQRIYDAFAMRNTTRFLEENLEAAFLRAIDSADVGDVILLSPACASFDEFESFEHRGRVFKDFIRRRSSMHGG